MTNSPAAIADKRFICEALLADDPSGVPVLDGGTAHSMDLPASDGQAMAEPAWGLHYPLAGLE